MFNKPLFYFCGVAGVLSLSPQVMQAGTQGDIGPEKPLYQSLATFTVGPDFVKKGQAKTLSLTPPFQNHYTNTHSSTTVADAGVFIGVEPAVPATA